MRKVNKKVGTRIAFVELGGSLHGQVPIPKKVVSREGSAIFGVREGEPGAETF